MSTKIEWTDEVWNPVTGCSKVSAGCKHCYAERIAERFWGERKFTDVVCHDDRLDIPLHWKKPRRVFVNSMSDLFHPDVPRDFIAAVWMRMLATPQHTYQILTKRPERMLEIVPTLFRHYQTGDPLMQSNIWLGVSCEDQQTADQRIPLLLQTPAAVRFVSLEPLLGAIDLWPQGFLDKSDAGIYGDDLDWVIVGGESGPGARPMHPDWVRSIRDQCVNAGVPFFFKQWGGVQKKKIATLDRGVIIDRFLDGQEWNEYPQK